MRNTTSGTGAGLHTANSLIYVIRWRHTEKRMKNKSIKDKKAELKLYNSLCSRIVFLEEKKSELWFSSLMVSPCTDKMPGTAPDGTQTERTVEKIDKLEADIKKLNAERNALKTKLEAALNNLQDKRLREVIKRLYLTGKKTDVFTVALDLNYSPRHINRLHKRALEKLNF